MQASMKASLYNYLIQHQQLPIPGLGTIYVERVPARTDFRNQQILPPFIKFRFDPYFDAPDQGLFRYIAEKHAIEDFEAIRWYNEWAFALRTDIKNNLKAFLNRVGTLIQDPSGEIVLESLDSMYAGAVPVHAERVIRQDQQHIVKVGEEHWTSSQMEEHLQELEENKSNNQWWIYAAIIAGVSGALWLYQFMQHHSLLKSWGSQFGLNY